jgi:hypothetical protein
MDRKSILKLFGLLGVVLVVLLGLRFALTKGADPVLITWIAIIGNIALVGFIVLSRRPR